MKKIILFSTIACLVLILTSCKKKDTDSDPKPQEKEYELIEMTTDYGIM
ncbi:MAG: hypothetical protein LC109_08805 [Bacteroidia bacterium]|nr:hypothetical protein [Bacteroidia bacterium]